MDNYVLTSEIFGDLEYLDNHQNEIDALEELRMLEGIENETRS